MALESGTYISDLVATNPTHTDGVNQADSHLRLLKSALKNTFPNIKGAVNATQDLLNTVATAFGTAGSLTLAGTPGLTLTNASGSLQVSGAVAATSVKADSAMNIGGKDVASNLVPQGAILMWAGSTTNIPSTWALCDGTQGTPDLRARFVVGAGGTYNPGAVGGSTSASTDAQGSHAHGASTGSAGSFTATVSTDQQGSHAHGGATQGYALGIDDLPAHTHQQAQSVQASVETGSSGTSMVVTSINGLSATNGPYTAAAGSGNAHTHGIGLDGTHFHNVTVSQGTHTHSIALDGTHTHTVATLPPYFALCYIMKL